MDIRKLQQMQRAIPRHHLFVLEERDLLGCQPDEYIYRLDDDELLFEGVDIVLPPAEAPERTQNEPDDLLALPEPDADGGPEKPTAAPGGLCDGNPACAGDTALEGFESESPVPRPPETNPAADALVLASREGEEGVRTVLTGVRASDVKAERLQWLWDERCATAPAWRWWLSIPSRGSSATSMPTRIKRSGRSWRR